jgi:hypothetical protein
MHSLLHHASPRHRAYDLAAESACVRGCGCIHSVWCLWWQRAFVHVDYRIRDVDDHDPHMPLARKTVVASCGAAAEDDESVPLVHMRGA